MALFCVSDSVRPEATQVVQTLRNDGINVYLLTGDGGGAERAVGKEVGIDSDCIKSKFLPEDKLFFWPIFRVMVREGRLIVVISVSWARTSS